MKIEDKDISDTVFRWKLWKEKKRLAEEARVALEVAETSTPPRKGYWTEVGRLQRRYTEAKVEEIEAWGSVVFCMNHVTMVHDTKEEQPLQKD